MTNKEIRKDATIKMKNNTSVIFLSLVLVSILTSIIYYISGFVPVLALPLTFILPLVTELSLTNLFLKISKNGIGTFNDLINPFRKNFLRKILTLLLSKLYLALWSILLWIPGIIKTFSYSQVIYLILDDKQDLSENKAIKASRQVMKGNKFRLFRLGVPFIIYYVLSFMLASAMMMLFRSNEKLALTTFIFVMVVLTVYIHPCFMLSLSNFYLDITNGEKVELEEKNKKENRKK